MLNTPLVECLDSAQLELPQSKLTVAVAKENGVASIVALFANSGAQRLYWNLTAADAISSNDEVCTVLPTAGHIDPGALTGVNITVDASSLAAQEEAYEFGFTLSSNSHRGSTRYITISSVVTSDLDPIESFLSLENADKIVASEEIAFTVTTVDVTGMRSLDASGATYVGTVQHFDTLTQQQCRVVYVDKKHRGTCQLPSLLTGAFRLLVDDGLERAVGRQNFSVSRCPMGMYSATDDMSGRVVCEICDRKSTECPSDGTSISNVTIRPGNWRTDSLSEDIRPCPSSDIMVCVGTISGLCKIGHTGAYCSVCEDGYFKDTRGVCAGCSSARAKWIGPSAVVCVCLLLGFVSLSQFILTGQVILCPRLCSCFGERKRRRRPSANLDATTETRQHILQLTSITKMVTNFGQILAGIGPT